MSGFFDQHPQFGATRSDRDQEVLDAIREKNDHIDQVMRQSLVGECRDCGMIGPVLLGWCDSCHSDWMCSLGDMRIGKGR